METMTEIENQPSPSFRDYRVQNDAVMVPDKGFTKQLHALDPELDVVWDWGASKWEIWRFPENGMEPFHCLTVQTKGRQYRELGADLLVQLAAGDPGRYTLNELVAYFDEMDSQIRRRKARDFTNKIESITMDTQKYQRGVLQIQVPKVFADIAITIDAKPDIPILDVPKEERVRRAIANA